MKSFTTLYLHFMRNRASRRNLRVLAQFLLILLPFTFIQFFYAPWIQAQEAALAPHELPAGTEGHVILTHYGPVDAALIKQLTQYQYPYVILVPEVTEALRLHDLDLKVVVGELAEGLDVFRVKIPPSLAGKTLTETAIRQRTGCNVIAIHTAAGVEVNPNPNTALPADGEMVVIGSDESEQQFLKLYVNR